MAMTTLQIIEARAPHLEGVARLPDLIALAQQELSQEVYGDRYNYAVALLVLHWKTLDARQGASGPVTSESEGQLSRSYGWSGEYGARASTSYGLELDALKKKSVITPRNRFV